MFELTLSHPFKLQSFDFCNWETHEDGKECHLQTCRDAPTLTSVPTLLWTTFLRSCSQTSEDFDCFSWLTPCSPVGTCRHFGGTRRHNPEDIEARCPGLSSYVADWIHCLAVSVPRGGVVGDLKVCFRAVAIKMRAFLAVAPCSLVQIDRRFTGAYCHHHKGDEFCNVHKCWFPCSWLNSVVIHMNPVHF